MILIFQCYDLITASLVLVKKLSEFFFAVFRVLQNFPFNQLRFGLIVSNPLLNELPSRIKRAYLTSLCFIKSMVEVDQCFILHLAEAAIASAILYFIMQRELYFVLRTVLAN